MLFEKCGIFCLKDIQIKGNNGTLLNYEQIITYNCGNKYTGLMCTIRNINLWSIYGHVQSSQ